jgi:pyruvate/2-oxoglutarate/acetoin dehydrogenase E1 component
MIQDLSYRQAINFALRAEMNADANVFVYGLDVDDHKTTFGSHEGLLQEFGSERIFGTPLSEEAMTGFGIGAALRGKKPVHVHIRADFSLLSTNQLINMASNIHYLSAGKLSVPFTVRIIVGRGWGQGMQHSKSLHSMFAHFPGLKVFAPATPQEAYSVLRSSIGDFNPTLIFEHRWLYDVIGKVDTDKKNIEGTHVLREGSDLTIVATSWMSVEAVRAAEYLAKNGINAEVINVNEISAINHDLISKSVFKTKNCIVTDHDWTPFGFNSEVAANVYERCLKVLKNPVTRLGEGFFPCPTARTLEEKFYPRAQEIISESYKLLNKSAPDLSGEIFYSHENKFKGPF